MTVLNIVIPMAGLGSRFADAGFEKPKPLIDVNGKPMIQLVVENLKPSQPHRFVFICQNSHIAQHGLRDFLEQIAPGSAVIGIDGITEGAACTVLAAERVIDNDTPLMIANSDQWIDASIDEYLEDWHRSGTDGHIMTMESSEEKWSYVKFDRTGRIVDVVEKVVVSNEATVGIYNFAEGRSFCAAARQMISENNRSKGEFYVAPVYKYMIDAGAEIGTFSIGADRDGMYGLGTPDDLKYFLKEAPSNESNN